MCAGLSAYTGKELSYHHHQVGKDRQKLYQRIYSCVYTGKELTKNTFCGILVSDFVLQNWNETLNTFTVRGKYNTTDDLLTYTMVLKEFGYCGHKCRHGDQDVA